MRFPLFALLMAAVLLGCQDATSQPPPEFSSQNTGQALIDARAIIARLKTLPVSQPSTAEEVEAIQQIAVTIREFDDYDSLSHALLRDEAIPLLLPHFDQMLPQAEDFETKLAIEELLHVFCLFQTDETLRRVVQMTKQDLPLRSELWDEYIWRFHPGTANYEAFWTTMLGDWPENEVVAIALLSQSNIHALDQEMPSHRHPFDSPEGLQHLRACLQTSQQIPAGYIQNSWEVDGDNPSAEAAKYAAESLAFITSPDRDELMQLAQQHPAAAVQLEAAWAGAKLGRQSGLDELVRRTHELPLSLTAQNYLEDVGRADLIPKTCFDEEFQIQAFCAQELASTFFKPGKIESIEILARQSLLWPLERMQVILVSYRIQFQDGDNSWVVEDVGHLCNSRFQASSQAIPIFNKKSPGDHLAGFSVNDIYGYKVTCQLDHTYVVSDKAFTEAYAEGDKALSGDESLPDGSGKLVGRAAIDLRSDNYPKAAAAIFETNNDDRDGWTVLDKNGTTFYAKEELPAAATAKHVLRMHIGRSYLSLPRRD
ncbi:hypothetical protein C5Y96_26035 [Blastopirellula marina]|uniref:HEAT repeat domain-containing protein n=1 Tax=Blastopirellula marina TaxID=124 RepID=A0A2S8EYH5_9BACT|nr:MULTISPECIES: hypothetical protein [Pirellulaceae]PQO24970.1 hypothetical protein C5Y96_26035 [Blastopirellula marina]RCS40822.1 hypothetical protein DTL36_26085 [Bremerella cremea]